MAVPLFHVDAFTDTPFAGNPAGVCLAPAPCDPAWMQAVAAELNLPATAFASPRDDGFELRWFAPRTELELCGHGTLAAAHVLWETATVPTASAARFLTRSGPLTAERADGWIRLGLPREDASPVEAPPALLAALGRAARWVGRNRLDHLVEVEDETAVRELAPDLALLERMDTRGVIVTSRAATPGLDFVSRFFAPRVGLAEDHVTGSAHCCLGPFWASRLGRNALRAAQLSARGGRLEVEVAPTRVTLAGRAVTVLRGALL
jgi:PhzF family phenazine biosynthesis protein